MKLALVSDLRDVQVLKQDQDRQVKTDKLSRFPSFLTMWKPPAEASSQ